jgi:DNA-binding PucR family transcriptional regulator
MAARKADSAGVQDQATARVAEVARTLGTTLTELAGAMYAELAEGIPELRGDPMILELLRASVESNIENFLHLAQHSLPAEDVRPPMAAVAYARRLAQRETSSNALLRAYRLGQRRIIDLGFAEIARQESDRDVAFAAAQLFHELGFTYVDLVSEAVVAEYESERERWLANRNTVRATMLSRLLDGHDVDVAAGENALGYRLRQNHLGVVIWNADRESSAAALRILETTVTAIAEAVGAAGQPLFIPRDHSLGWAWIPLGRQPVTIDVAALHQVVADADGSVRAALGTSGAAIPGFRSTHLEAVRAHTVATIADSSAQPVTTYNEPGVRAAALLAGDLGSARDLVANALGGLGVDDESVERLRDTLLEFLTEGGSYLSTAERIHVHKNTVKYRVDKAIELRGRPLDDDRFNLELGLLACRWLGRAVLSG